MTSQAGAVDPYRAVVVAKRRSNISLALAHMAKADDIEGLEGRVVERGVEAERVEEVVVAVGCQRDCRD